MKSLQKITIILSFLLLIPFLGFSQNTYTVVKDLLDPMSQEPLLKKNKQQSQELKADELVVTNADKSKQEGFSQDQKALAYQLFTTYYSQITGQEILYCEEEYTEGELEEEMISITPEMFFDPSNADGVLLEGVATSHSYAPMVSEIDLAVRLAQIEKDIPLNLTPEVRHFVDYYGIRYRSFVEATLKRSKTYFPLFEKILAEYDIPEEVKFLSVIESGLKPEVRSRAGAVGLWQFMPRTGRNYGLKQNYYVDYRRSPERATRAACKYLKYLHNKFNDWELALAAYNCGPGGVMKAQRLSGKTSFWDIYPYLPRETRSYLPKYVAINYLMSHAEEHNFIEDETIFAIEVDTVYTSQYVNLQRLADEINVCYQDLKALNPEIKRGIIPYYTKNFPLRIPANRKSYFEDNKTAILLAAQAKGSYVSHTRKTKTNPKIATSYQGNRGGGRVSSTTGKKKIIYSVRNGDTLGAIALRYGTSTASLKAWNGLYSSRINIGQKITLWTNSKSKNTVVARSKTKSKTKVSYVLNGKFHVVRSGDTLWDIANKYPNMTVSKLKKMNHLTGNKLKIGQKLKLI